MPADPTFDPSSLRWEDSPPDGTTGPSMPSPSPWSAGDPAHPALPSTFTPAVVHTTRPGRTGAWALALSVGGAVLAAGSLWAALDSVSISDHPLGSALRWMAVVGGAGMILVLASVLGLVAVATSRGRRSGAAALLTSLVLSPLLSFVSVSLGMDALQERARASLRSGAGVGLDRVVDAMREAGVPEGPARILIEGEK